MMLLSQGSKTASQTRTNSRQFPLQLRSLPFHPSFHPSIHSSSVRWCAPPALIHSIILRLCARRAEPFKLCMNVCVCVRIQASPGFRLYNQWSIRLELAHQAAAAVEFMHSHNVVHRDLTSNNLLVTDKWEAKVRALSKAHLNLLCVV